MVNIEQIAAAALAGDALGARSLMQDWIRGNPAIANCAAPQIQDVPTRAISAGLVELMADRLGQKPPAWTAQIGPLPAPIFLVQAAAHMPRLRHLCETESPLPLRRRNIFVPPDYLTFA